jgi:hypothetical protein
MVTSEFGLNLNRIRPNGHFVFDAADAMPIESTGRR